MTIIEEGRRDMVTGFAAPAIETLVQHTVTTSLIRCPVGSYQFELIDGDPFYLAVTETTARVHSGYTRYPDVTFTGRTDDITAVTTGNARGPLAVRTGRLTVSGPTPRLAARLDVWLRRTVALAT